MSFQKPACICGLFSRLQKRVLNDIMYKVYKPINKKERNILWNRIRQREQVFLRFAVSS